MVKRSYRIVICDDNEKESRMLKHLLEGEGYKVIEQFVNGRELVTWCRDHPGGVDLIVLDILMPVLDGYAAFWELIDLKPFPRVLFLSVENSAQLIKELLDNGAVDYVTKPYKRLDFLERVKNGVRLPPPG